jgi:DNA repair exonuclease SbcCD ATPase subunit
MTLREKLNRLLAQKDHLEKRSQEEQEEIEKTKQELGHSQKALLVLQEIATQLQESAASQIEAVVSRCLRAVFGEEAYDFKVIFEGKRNQTEARLVFLRNQEEIDPLTASGGGVVDVASFALRLACLLLSQPAQRRFLALDEPFKHLDKDRLPLARELLLSLSKEMEVQFLIVTHNRELEIGEVVEIA